MAKELPYFKFESSEWDNGNIQICSKKSKGLFIDICSMYWTRLGELPYALALQKHCNGDANEMQELIDSEVIIVDDGQIIIQFLDEQLSEFAETSEKRRIAANKRWDAIALQKQSKSNAIRGEKKRKEKIKEDTIPTFDEFKIYTLEKEPNINIKSLKFKYDSWVENDWKTGSDKKIKNWKSTLLNTLQYIDKNNKNETKDYDYSGLFSQ